ncbi:MAG: YggT family protein [Candidatus Levybacteria bacterium]|nr:YggT family protein [Candidatus Levybacteria bacterium]
MSEHPQKVFEKKKTIFQTHQIIWYIVGVIEVLLGFRMALKALGANQTSFFTSMIYTLSDPLVLPFSGILPTSGTITATFEWSTIIAAVVYLILALGITELIRLLKPVTPDEVEHTV